MYTGFATIGVLQNKRKAQFNLAAENADYLYVGPITEGITNYNNKLIIHLMYNQGKYKWKQKHKWTK